MKKLHYLVLFVLAASGLAIASYDMAPPAPITPENTPVPVQNIPIPPPSPAPVSTNCDPALWGHVYNPQRLIVQDQCTTVTGVMMDASNGRFIDGVRHEADGDTHGWIKLDPQYANMINQGNVSNEQGNLVFEIICHFPITQQDAIGPCAGFQDSQSIPPIGSHVSITGSYVQDTNHAKWMEIHPVSNISIIP